jgi:hypothetical protein
MSRSSIPITATNLIVEHAHPAGGDRGHGQFLVTGDAELAHDEHVHRRIECTRNLVGDRHTAARGSPSTTTSSRRA